MGETETHHFYDFGIFGRVPEPQSQYYLCFETPGCLKSQETPWKMFGNIMFVNLQILEIPNRVNVGKDARRNMVKIRQINSWKSGIWDQYPSKLMKWEFGNMDQIPFENIKGCLHLWNQEANESKIQETKHQINNTNNNNNNNNKKPIRQ